MADLSGLSHDELAAHIRDGLVEAEARLTANGNHPMALKAVKVGHGALDLAAQRLVGGGVIQPMDGDPKP